MLLYPTDWAGVVRELGMSTLIGRTNALVRYEAAVNPASPRGQRAISMTRCFAEHQRLPTVWRIGRCAWCVVNGRSLQGAECDYRGR